MSDCRLENNSTVVIIGGGPGGAACAIKLLQSADARGIRLRVLIFEGKDFHVHANQCVGVLSPPIEEVLAEELELQLPPALIKRQIFGYRLHGPRENLLLTGQGAHAGEPGHGRATYAVERAEFDQFMLDRARELGAKVINSRVTGVEFVRTGELDEVRVYSESSYERADVLVGAFGLDEAMMSVLEDVTRNDGGFERPSKWLKSYLTTIETSAHFQTDKLGHIVHAFLLPPRCPRVEFGAITPKGDHILVNIAGERVSSCDLDEFLQMPQVQALLPSFDPAQINYYEGRFPSAPARGAYGHRYALIGDATGWLRPFKGKGISTAIVTGIRAAETMLEHGVSKRAFEHYRRACNDLLGDYHYGVMVRRLMLLGARVCLDPMIDVGKTDPLMYDALFNSVSGHDSYRNIIKRSFKARLVRKVAARAVRGVGRHRAHRRARRSMQDLTVRKMTVRDIDEVMRIDEKITGKPHAAYYESKAAAYISRAPEYCLVAEHRDRVVGFVLGDVHGWEFASVLAGWLEIIGVDPEYHGQGVSRALMDELFARFRKAGVAVVNTMVNWNDGDLIDYFRANGFDRGEYVNLVKRLDEETMK
ncbi:MAG TPA: GNAT family N-acetyltransferase [Pyrinomonadaceae bacterium]|jgi:flavin-dependent dehydrogenase/ribosomal protein S18 acetylase RimI-like enzyme